MASLYELSAENQQLQVYLEDNGGELTPELEEAYFANEVALAGKVDSYADLINYNKRREAICDEQVKFFTGLKKQFNNTHKRLTDRMKQVLEIREENTGEKVLQGEFHKFYLQNVAATQDIDEELFFARFQAEMGEIKARFAQYGITVDFKADKTALKELYPKDGAVTPAGVVWNQGSKSLRMK